jgi:hypothetical protein
VGADVPAGLHGLRDETSALLSRSTQLLAAPRRHAVLGYLRDQVIATCWGVSAAEVETGVTAMRTTAPAHLKTFVLNGNAHVVYDVPSASRSFRSRIPARSPRTRVERLGRLPRVE